MSRPACTAYDVLPAIVRGLQQFGITATLEGPALANPDRVVPGRHQLGLARIYPAEMIQDFQVVQIAGGIFDDPAHVDPICRASHADDDGSILRHG